MLALDSGFVLSEHSLDYLARLIERPETPAESFEVDPKALMLQLIPSGSYAEIEPAAAYMVERGGHLRRQARIAIGIAVDERADAGALRMLAECAQQRPVLHAGTGRVGREDRVEMIKRPQRVVAPPVEFYPDVAHPLPRDILLS